MALYGGSGVLASVKGNLPHTAGSFSAAQKSELERAHLQTQVTNTITNGAVNYDNFQFNSFCTFAGKYLAAGQYGLYQVDSDLKQDDGQDVTWSLTTGDMSFGDEHQKRVSDVYLGMSSEDDLPNPVIVSFKVDEQPVQDYELSTYDVSRIKSRRVLVGKGLRGKYWRMTIKGSKPIRIDDVTVVAAVTDRRI